jgi:tetratricopeptide (TPR) repeat protein
VADVRAGKGGTKHGVPASRRERLDVAERFLKKGRLRKALEQYLALLGDEPNQPALHVKAAELLIKLRRLDEARPHLDSAAAGYERQGFAERQLAVFRTTAAHWPHEVELWETMAGWQNERGYRAEAVRTLLEGRRKLSARRSRRDAIRLLRGVLALDPSHLPATFELARLLTRIGERGEARRMYEAVARHQQGAWLVRARLQLLLLSATPAAGWRLGRAILLRR